MMFPTISPGAKFSEYDLVKALFNLEETSYGRNKLMQELSLSEASTRSLMDNLKDAGYAMDSTKGLLLTKKGQTFVENLHKKLSGPVLVDNFEQISIAFLVKGVSRKVNLGLTERDTAVRAGANGALVLVISKGKFGMPGAKEFEKENKNLFEELQDKLKPEDGDVVIMAFSSSEKTAGAGAWAATKTFI